MTPLLSGCGGKDEATVAKPSDKELSIPLSADGTVRLELVKLPNGMGCDQTLSSPPFLREVRLDDTFLSSLFPHAAIFRRERMAARSIAMRTPLAKRQCMPGPVSRVPISSLQADSTIPEPITRCRLRSLR